MLRSVACKTRRHPVSEHRPNIDADSQLGTGEPGPRHRGEAPWVDGVATHEAYGRPIKIATGSPRTDRLTGAKSPTAGMYEGNTVNNSVDNRPQEASDRGSAVRTSMLLVGILAAGVSLLHLPASLVSQANTQVEKRPPIVKASDKWITLGVDTSSSQVPTALDQPAMSW
jgi:hypothetical protein